MFRKPRENASSSSDEINLPSVGRPPTPPPLDSNGWQSSPCFSSSDAVNGGNGKASLSRTPTNGRQTAFRANPTKKPAITQNRSILNFFSKTDKKDADLPEFTGNKSIFFEEKTAYFTRTYSAGEGTGVGGTDGLVQIDDEIDSRYNEAGTSMKRQKLEETDLIAIRTPSPELGPANREPIHARDQYVSEEGPQRSDRNRGGFVDDSDDEEGRARPYVDNEIQNSPSQPMEQSRDQQILEVENEQLMSTEPASINPIELSEDIENPRDSPNRASERQSSSVQIPSLTREATSIAMQDDFDENDNFEDDEFFDGGEEYMERRWMEEQAEMEAAFDEDSKSESDGSVMTPADEFQNPFRTQDEEAVSTCPICSGSLRGFSEADVSSHVNACLDGTAAPLPKSAVHASEIASASSVHNALSGSDKWQPKRFQRAAIARPGQANPFSFSNQSKPGQTSAFTKLMSGHAEDAAWAEAAANELQSRGKPAYQRTCPFYKIMPGLYICVDAFRYGKVEGQNAYFLSHFHSDHYIGLTSSWCHGPIFGSKVTVNLIRQQLRVEEKWLFPLQFEKKVEVPHTNGVHVTMIPANHCPGSSLFVFEKVIGRNKDGSPKLNRILHCGDFRACPAHVAHPLLRPDVIDAVTGQIKQQKIDTCYLDTTYLTPKYSFPSQHDVIDACAQMCVSLSKDIVDSGDAWEKVQAERAGAMTKFLGQGEKVASVKEEDHSSEDKKIKQRGKLLVVIGTYSIGKERICLGIAKALNSKIYAPPGKMRVCKCLEDEQLNERLTSNPLEAQVHMQTLMEIRAETLQEYLSGFKGHFARVVGFRPTGWTYRPPTSRLTENPAVSTVLHSEGWKSRFTMRELVPQRGSTKQSACFGVPYSEHSSFRELTMFCCALRIGRVVPTVNVGSARSREKMKAWVEKWEAEKKKNGLFKVDAGSEGWGSGDGGLQYGV